MSGRSAHVRKEKTKVKDGGAAVHDGFESPSILENFPVPHSNGRQLYFEHDLPLRTHSDLGTIKSGSSGSDDLAYARVRKPHVPVIDISGIEKSSFRSLMDKKSENVRRGLAKTFSSKKKKGDEADDRPETAATIRPEYEETDGGTYFSPPLPVLPVSKSQTQQFNQPPEYIRPGPPSTKLPPIPQGPQLKRWIGAGRPAQPWNKLRKDPELWDPNGDTLVFLGHETPQSARPLPSFRISSHVLETTDSEFLITLLREGSTEEAIHFGMPPSPISSSGSRPAYPVHPGQHQPTPPTSENSLSRYDGQISYEIYFPAPPNQSRTDTLRHQITTRNVFALLYGVSLVGFNLFETLSDLHERLESYLPSDTDACGLIIEYLTTKGIDDLRNNPSVAAALLAWCETTDVRWEEGWREAYVHSAGMYSQLEAVADFRFITPITRALLARASLETQVRVQSCEDRLAEFDFGDMWPMMSSQPPPSRACFERLRKFFLQFYEDAVGRWPPLAPAGEEQWLTRDMAQRLQKDFGALYNYLVNREVTWDGSEERSGRKWNIVHAGDRSFDADTFDLPLTDLLVAFDNRHKYPHIPHPYPLVPDSIPVKPSKETPFKANKKTYKTSADEKIAERRAALAYTESTNIYLLGSDFVNNDMVDAFVRFEKADRATEVDPFAARRGRWVLIYGILQTIATVSVDTPDLRLTGDVSYHLNPRLRGTPPWRKGVGQNFEEASHVGSYCWTIRDSWRSDIPVQLINHPLENDMSVHSSATAPSVNNSDAGWSTRTPLSFTSTKSRSDSKRRNQRLADSSESNYLDYGPDVEDMEQWPLDSRAVNRSQKSSPIKDVDDYKP